MSSLGAFLGRLVAVLDASEVPYLLTGSVAAAYHGPPRTTQDVDVVIDLAPGQVERLKKNLDPDVFYFDEDTLREAVARRGQFNLVDLQSGWKADLILKKARPYSHQEFQHRIRVRVFDLELWIARAEDT